MKGNAPTLAVLEAKTNHLLAIAELEAETLPGPWGVETLTSLMANAHGLVLVATRASREGTERLIGYAAVSWVLDEAELLRLTVSQKQRRRGVGRRLVAAVLSRLRQLGVERLRLEVRANMSEG